MATQADFERIGNYALILNPQPNIDRSHATRAVPMQVLCLGYSRTGTLSMHKALSILGYPNPYHFSSICGNVLESDLWMKALRAKFFGEGPPVHTEKAFWDALLGHVSAITDSPANLFGEELVQLYPEAKVVLVERPIDSWFESWMAFCESAYDPSIGVLGKLDPWFFGRVAKVGSAITQISAGFAANVDQVKARSKAAYKHHYRDVREYVPKERLLDFRLEQGWKPLCEFLGKDVPGEPFPHVNEKESNKRAFETMGKVCVRNIMKKVFWGISLVQVPLFALWWYGWI